jgi:hypothetical protein
MLKKIIITCLSLAFLNACGVKGNLKPNKEMKDRLEKSGRPVPVQNF